MKVSKLIEKLRDRRDEYLHHLTTGSEKPMKNAIEIHEVIVDLEDHVLILGDHEMGADWRLDA